MNTRLYDTHSIENKNVRNEGTKEREKKEKKTIVKSIVSRIIFLNKKKKNSIKLPKV